MIIYIANNYLIIENSYYRLNDLVWMHTPSGGLDIKIPSENRRIVTNVPYTHFQTINGESFTDVFSVIEYLNSFVSITMRQIDGGIIM
jgi:hypothetical protein